VVSCQLPLSMAEEIVFENGRISNFEGLVTLTSNLVIPSCITDQPHFVQIEETLCGQTYVRTHVGTYGWMDGHLRPALLGRLCQRVHLKITFLIHSGYIRREKEKHHTISTGISDSAVTPNSRHSLCAMLPNTNGSTRPGIECTQR